MKYKKLIWPLYTRLGNYKMICGRGCLDTTVATYSSLEKAALLCSSNTECIGISSKVLGHTYSLCIGRIYKDFEYCLHEKLVDSGKYCIAILELINTEFFSFCQFDD